VGINGALIPGIFVAAHPVHQLIPGVDPPRSRGHGRQDSPFGGSQVEGGAVEPRLVGTVIDLQPLAAVACRARRGPRFAVPMQNGLHAQHDFVGTERLRHVVVGAEFQALDAVLRCASGGEDDHREGSESVDFPKDVGAVDVRKAQVEEHQLARGQEAQCLRTGRGREHGEPGSFEVATENVADITLVLDDQHGGHTSP